MIHVDFDPSTIEGSVLLVEADITSLAGLKDKLQNGSKLSLYLLAQFSALTLHSIQNYDSSQPNTLRHSLLAELNRLLTGPSLYDKQRFRGVVLTDRTRN